MLGRKSLVVFSGQWATYTVQVVSSILVARSLGPALNGAMGFAFGIVGLFMIVTGLGFAQAHQKRVAEGAPLDLCLGTYAAVTLALNALAALACLACWPFFRDIFSTAVEKQAFFLFFAYQVLLNFSTIFNTTLVGRGEVAKSSVCAFLAKLARLVFVGLAVLWFPNLRGIALAFVGEGVVLLASFWYVSSEKRFRRPTRASLESYWSYTKPLAVTAPFGVLGDSADRVIGGMHWSLDQLGHYNVARNFLGIAKNVPSAGITALFPKLTELYSQGKLDDLRRVFNQSCRKLLLVMTPLVVGGVLLSEPVVLLLYGRAFLPAAQAMAGFMGMVWLNTLLAPYQFLVYAMERHHKFARIMPLNQLSFIAAFYLVTKFHLPWGLGLAALVGAMPSVVPMKVVSGLCREYAGISFDWGALRFVAAGALMVVSHCALRWLISGVAGWVAGIVGGGCVYMLAVFLLGKADRSDFVYLAEVLNPVKLLKYVMSEVGSKT